MHLRIYDPRIIALDLRSRRSGFAVFEGPRRLLDFGTTATPAAYTEDATKGLSGQLKLWLPQIIVVREDRWNDCEMHQEMKSWAGILRTAARSGSFQIHLISQAAIRESFRNLRCRTKAEISTALARIFPELIWYLPPERKLWESEHPRQTVFDAIALGLAYWQHEASSVLPEPEENLL